MIKRILKRLSQKRKRPLKVHIIDDSRRGEVVHIFIGREKIAFPRYSAASLRQLVSKLTEQLGYKTSHKGVFVEKGKRVEVIEVMK